MQNGVIGVVITQVIVALEDEYSKHHHLVLRWTDLVLKNPYDWQEIETDSFDLVISGQAFEHIEFFWITMSEMTRVLKKDGLMCVIAPNGYGEHRYPVDCYRFFTDGMVALGRYVSLESMHAHTNLAPKGNSKGWYSKSNAGSMLIAKKKYSGNTKYFDVKTYVCTPPDHSSLNSNFVPKLNLLKKLFKKKA